MDYDEPLLPGMNHVTPEEKRRELIREIALRERVYTRTLQEAPHRKDELHRRIEVMKAILKDYENAASAKNQSKSRG